MSSLNPFRELRPMDERSIGTFYREDQSIKDKSNIAKQRPPTQQ